MQREKTMLKVLPKITLMLAVGIGLGIVCSSTLALQLRGLANRITNNDSWITIDGIGSRDADPLLRALIARIGIFANSKDRAVYFNGYVGSPLTRLKGGRHYQITGLKDLPSAWWSITLYDADNLLFANPDNRYSFTNFNLKTDESGGFVIDVAPERPLHASNWLPSPDAGNIYLALRIYEPAPALQDSLATYPLPRLAEVH